VSSAAEGWYVDPSTGTNLRYWNGSTWTDEVAPLPADALRPGQFTAQTTAQEPTEVQDVEEPEARVPDVQVPDVKVSDSDIPDADAPSPPLDTDLEHTRLTRRELRARRGTDPLLNDAPKHLPPIAPPPLPAESADEPPPEVAIPPMQVAEPPAPEPSEKRMEKRMEKRTESSSRRWRIVRLSVLLGILAVVSSVGVLTAGTL